MTVSTSRLTRKFFLKFGVSVFLLAILVAFGALHALVPGLYKLMVVKLYDINGEPPFADLRDILQAGVCWRHGVNVYAPSACLNGGIFNYSPLLLYVANLPIDVSDRVSGGIIMALVFIVSVSLLPSARSTHELWIRYAAAGSTAVWYAIEQGNLDIFLFALVMLGVWLLCDKGRLSWLSYALFGLVAAAKFYPAALFILGLRERLVRLMLLVMIAGVAACLILIIHGSGILRVLHAIPLCQPFRATFGARDLLSGLALLHVLPWRSAPHVIRPYYPDIALSSARGWQDLLTALMSFGALALASVRVKHYASVLLKISKRRLTFLVAGALIIVFCFFAAQNVYYRSIYLLMLVPGYWDLAYPRSGKGDRCARWILIMIPVLLWEALIRQGIHGVTLVLFPAGFEAVVAIIVWLVRELLWWWLIIELMGLIIAIAHHELLRLNRELRHLCTKN
ncbi:MAG: glycosyltransferase 87 family protein [Acidocella sp.]|nr:glycosyltransferase 87 family protein [Acidocella sp.]